MLLLTDYRNRFESYLLSIQAQAGVELQYKQTEDFATQQTRFTPWVQIGGNVHIGDNYSTGWFSSLNVTHINPPASSAARSQREDDPEKAKKEKEKRDQLLAVVIGAIVAGVGAFFAGMAGGQWRRYAEECEKTNDLYVSLMGTDLLPQEAQPVLDKILAVSRLAYKVQYAKYTTYRLSTLAWTAIAVSGLALAVAGASASSVGISAATVALITATALKLLHMGLSWHDDYTDKYQQIYRQSAECLTELGFWNNEMTQKNQAPLWAVPQLFAIPPSDGAGVGDPSAPPND
jgi:hypothetical protein